MVRAKHSGAVQGPQETPTPQKPRRHRDLVAEREEAGIDEGFVASPDNPSAFVEAGSYGEADSAYASSASALGGTRPSQNRRRAVPGKRGTCGKLRIISKVVVLRVTPSKLRTWSRAHEPTKKVSLKVPPEKLRLFAQKDCRSHLGREPIGKNRQYFVSIKTAKMGLIMDNRSHDVLDDHLKEVIQNLFDLGNITHGYLAESQGPLIQKSIDLTHSLASLSALTADNSPHPAARKLRSMRMPPEVIDYVANGRNPDVYTRQFVENVQRGNYVLNGKMQAFGSFVEIYARETKSAIPDLAADVDRLMEHAGDFEREEGGQGDWKMKKRGAQQVNGSRGR